MKSILSITGFFVLTMLVSHNSFADKALWNEYTIAHRDKNCARVIEVLDQLIKVDPEKTTLEIATLYEDGKCKEKDVEKAIQYYQSVPYERMIPLYAYKFMHLKFSIAQTESEKQEAVSGARHFLMEDLPNSKNSEELKNIIEIVHPTPGFVDALEEDFTYIKSIEENVDLKLSKIRTFIDENKYQRLSDIWLMNLRNEGNIQAYYLSAQLKDNEDWERKSYLKTAARGGHPNAQKELAVIYEAENDRGSFMHSYYWNLKAEQNGVDVNDALDRLRKVMSKSDQFVMEEEAAKETPSIPF